MNSFRHYTRAVHEIDILCMRAEFGMEGYGLYWTLIEIMATSNGNKIPLDDINTIAMKEGIDASLLEKFILYCVYTGNLFKTDGDYIWTERVKLKKVNFNKRMYSLNVKEWYRLIKQVFIRDNFTCYYCGKVGGKLEADHKTPFSKGGTDDIENLVTACRKCNRQKKDKSVEEFLKWRELNG